MKRALTCFERPSKRRPLSKCAEFSKSGFFTYILGLKFNHDDFGRERIDDDGLDDAVGDYAD